MELSSATFPGVTKPESSSWDVCALVLTCVWMKPPRSPPGPQSWKKADKKLARSLGSCSVARWSA
eukprot:274606-Amphidinium_carterae.1